MWGQMGKMVNWGKVKESNVKKKCPVKIMIYNKKEGDGMRVVKLSKQ